MTEGYTDFEFDLSTALLDRLIETLDRLNCATMNEKNIGDIPDEQGVYQLYLNDTLVYIGKTDADAGLRRRLVRHMKKVQHRMGLELDHIFFKSVRIYVFTPLDLESQLIKYYNNKAVVEWTNSGFGANDPGRERDTTKYKNSHFDKMYPIDIERPISIDLPPYGTAATVLQKLKVFLPYLFRFEKIRNRPHPDLQNTKISLESLPHFTTKAIISTVVKQLPDGWQATQLPSHIILYREARHYPSGTVIAQS